MNGLLKRFLTWAFRDVIQDVIDSEENQIDLEEIIDNQTAELKLQVRQLREED